MTETQGDYLGCIIVLAGLIPLLAAVHYAGLRRHRLVVAMIGLSSLLSIAGVATVILT